MIIKMVKSGGVLLPTAPWLWDSLIDRLTDGAEVLCEMREVGADRSLNQNALFHKLCQRYAETQEEGLTWAKDELCIEYGTDNEELDVTDQFAIAEAFIRERPWPVRLTIHRGAYWIRRSTTSYTVKQMNRLIEGAFKSIIEAGGYTADLEQERGVI